MENCIRKESKQIEQNACHGRNWACAVPQKFKVTGTQEADLEIWNHCSTSTDRLYGDWVPANDKLQI